MRAGKMTRAGSDRAILRITVLNQAIFSIPPEAIRDVTVYQTIVGGRTVYHIAKSSPVRVCD